MNVAASSLLINKSTTSTSIFHVIHSEKPFKYPNEFCHRARRGEDVHAISETASRIEVESLEIHLTGSKSR